MIRVWMYSAAIAVLATALGALAHRIVTNHRARQDARHTGRDPQRETE